MRRIFLSVLIIFILLAVTLEGAGKPYQFSTVNFCSSCLEEMKSSKKYEPGFACESVSNKKSNTITYTMIYTKHENKTGIIKLKPEAIRMTDADIKTLCPKAYKESENDKNKKK